MRITYTGEGSGTVRLESDTENLTGYPRSLTVTFRTTGGTGEKTANFELNRVDSKRPAGSSFKPLAVYGGRCAWWRPDLALVADEDGALTMVSDGRSELLFQYGTDTTNGEEAAILLADGRLVLRAPDGARTEVATGLESIRDEEGAWVSVLGVRDGVALLSVIDAANPEGVCRLYDASGLLYDTAGTGYQRLNELTAGPDGPVYAAPRFTPGRSGLLYDIVDAHGHVILSGLADVSAYGLPDGVFSARRGYERGYMDLAGEWLYRESVFTALGDDEGYGW